MRRIRIKRIFRLQNQKSPSLHSISPQYLGFGLGVGMRGQVHSVPLANKSQDQTDRKLPEVDPRIFEPRTLGYHRWRPTSTQTMSATLIQNHKKEISKVVISRSVKKVLQHSISRKILDIRHKELAMFYINCLINQLLNCSTTLAASAIHTQGEFLGRIRPYLSWLVSLQANQRGC